MSCPASRGVADGLMPSGSAASKTPKPNSRRQSASAPALSPMENAATRRHSHMWMPPTPDLCEEMPGVRQHADRPDCRRTQRIRCRSEVHETTRQRPGARGLRHRVRDWRAASIGPPIPQASTTEPLRWSPAVSMWSTRPRTRCSKTRSGSAAFSSANEHPAIRRGRRIFRAATG